MPEIDPLVVKLIADHNKYIADLKKSESHTRAFEKGVSRDVQKLENQFRKSSSGISMSLKGIAATIATVFTGRELAGVLDSFTRFQNQLRVAGVEGSNLKAVQDALFSSAQRYGVELETIGTLYGRVAQASSELGISQSELLLFTDRVSAAVKVQGGDAQAASGALLQMAQALQSGTVRAEEFNSINEGLLPVLQSVAAGSDRFGGSVAKLRAAVLEGTVSSREFFNSFIAGSDILANKAARSTLTLSASLATLNNAFTVYFGEADKANGISAALGSAINKLAENVDVLIPALAVLGTALGVGFVANAAKARIATAAASASMAGLTTAAYTARTASLALSTALGGPVGIALTALTVGIGYAVTSSAELTAEIENLSAAAGTAADELAILEEKAREAGIDTDKLGQSAADGTGDILGIGNAARFAAMQFADLAENARLAAIATAKTRIAEAQAVKDRAEGILAARVGLPQLNTFATLGLSQSGDELRKGIEDANRAISIENRKIELITALPEEAFESSGGGSSSQADKGRKAKRSNSTINRAAREEARYLDELSQLRLDRLRVETELHGNAQSRLKLAEAEIRAEGESFVRSIALDGSLSAAKREKLLAERQLILEQRRALAQQQFDTDLAEENAELKRSELEAQRGSLQFQADVARSSKERLDAEIRLINLSYDIERAELDRILATRKTADIEYQIAADRKKQLDRLRQFDIERAKLGNQSPGERFLDNISKTAGEIDDDVQKIAVNGLQNLNDQLVDAILNAKSLGDVFSSVAKSIIADLLRIAIQQSVVKPLAESLFGGSSSGGGGFGSILPFFGDIFPRASGGFVAPGQLVRVNEGASPGRVEGFRPTGSGDVIPLGHMNVQPRMASPGGGAATVRLQLSEDLDARMIETSGAVAVEVFRVGSDQIVERSVAETFRRAGRPRP